MTQIKCEFLLQVPVPSEEEEEIIFLTGGNISVLCLDYISMIQFLFLCFQVRASSQTKGLERG